MTPKVAAVPLIAGHCRRIALGPALAVHEREVKGQWRRNRGLTIPTRDVNDALTIAPGRGAPLHEAEQVGKDEALPVHQPQWLACLGSLDIHHPPGEGHRVLHSDRMEIP